MKHVVAALIWKDGKILICQRTRHQVMPLKWEFPGGKIEEGEQPRDALRRELDEELGINAVIGHEVARIRHQYPSGNSVELRFYVSRRKARSIVRFANGLLLAFRPSFKRRMSIAVGRPRRNVDFGMRNSVQRRVVRSSAV